MPYLLAGVTDGQVGAMNSGSGDLYESANEAMIGRLNYSYQDRYLLEGQFRYDGLQSLPKDTDGASSLLYQQVGEYQKSLSLNLLRH